MKRKSGPDTTGFQFSLRTLILAVTLAAVTLSSVALVGAPVAVLLTLYFLLLLAIRIKWECDPGFPVAMVVTGLLAACPFVYAALFDSVAYLPKAVVAFFVGPVVGSYCFVIVHGVVCIWDGEPFDLHQITTRPVDGNAGAEQLEGSDVDLSDR